LASIDSVNNSATGHVKAALNQKKITLNNDGIDQMEVSGTAETAHFSNQ